MNGGFNRIAALAMALGVGACATTEEIALYSDRQAGFATVSQTAQSMTSPKQAVWIQGREHAQEIAEQVRARVFGKTIDVETAVQIALINNRGLQASYAQIGMSAADAWQTTLPENPKISVGVFGIATPEFGLFRAIESIIATNILSIATQRKRIDIADIRLRQAQLNAASETLRVASQTRRAWIGAVGAFEKVLHLNQAKSAADAASELAQKLGESGALTQAGQAREHAFYAELTGQMAEARLAASLAKEELTKLMGLWGSDINYFVADVLPDLPKKLATKQSIEAAALQNRIDLAIAKLELDAVAKSFGLTTATRFVTDFEILGGFEKEKEIETEYELEPGPELTETALEKSRTTPQIELEFVIPIFDTGAARVRKAEAAYMQAANLLAEKAVAVRSEARSAYTAYRATFDIARHYRNAVLPLRTKIEEESLLTYNGMITNTFELLADTRAKINTVLLAGNAKREFWLADANIATAIFGGEAVTTTSGGTTSVADAPQAH